MAEDVSPPNWKFLGVIRVELQAKDPFKWEIVFLAWWDNEALPPLEICDI